MSMGSLGLIGSIAGTQLAQIKGSDVDKGRADAAHQQRQTEAVERADAAAGIGVTQEDSSTSDRDADGRRLWEAPAPSPTADAAESSDPLPRSKDPTGAAGQQLDLSG